MKKQALLFLIFSLLFGFSKSIGQTISFSGTVYDDGTEGPTSGVPTNQLGTQPLYAIYSSAYGYDIAGQQDNLKIVAFVPVAPDGSYHFTNVPKLSFGRVSLALTSGAVGDPTPSSALSNTIRAGAVDNHFQTDFLLAYPFITAIDDQAIINFRFNQLPTANSITVPTQPIADNGTSQITVPPLTGADPEDGIYDGVSGNTTVAIAFSLQNPALYYKGKPIQTYETVVNYSNIIYRLDKYDPTQLKVVPAKGQTTASFQYYVIDAANRFSANLGTVTLSFTASPLPVALVSFEGKWIEGRSIELSWQTARELDNDYFEVQRSTDAKSFESIGRVSGNVNTSTSQSYRFVDSQPLADLSYYRLQQHDLDGTTSYSKTIAVHLSEQGSITSLLMYPNPSSDFVRLQLANQQSVSEIRMYNEAGRQVLSQGTAISLINLQSLASGPYVVEVKTSAGQILRQRLLKQ